MNAQRRAYYRHRLYLNSWVEYGTLYPPGWDESFRVCTLAELVTEYGAIAEGRFERGPFSPDEPFEYLGDSMGKHLPDEYIVEHEASMRRRERECFGAGHTENVTTVHQQSSLIRLSRESLAHG